MSPHKAVHSMPKLKIRVRPARRARKKGNSSAKQLGDVVGSVLNAGDKSCAGEKEIHP